MVSKSKIIYFKNKNIPITIDLLLILILKTESRGQTDLLLQEIKCNISLCQFFRTRGKQGELHNT